jgi:hypothetical protein
MSSIGRLLSCEQLSVYLYTSAYTALHRQKFNLLRRCQETRFRPDRTMSKNIHANNLILWIGDQVAPRLFRHIP